MLEIGMELNWWTENRTLLGEVARKQRELRASKLPASVVRAVVGEVVPHFVHATNTWEGAQLTFNETKWWCSLALSEDFDFDFKRRSAESIDRAVPKESNTWADAAAVVNGSQLYAQLIPNIADGFASASTEPAGALPIRSGFVTESLLHRVTGLVRGSKIPPDQQRNYRDRPVKVGMEPILLARPEACAPLMSRLVNQIHGVL